MNYDAFMEPVTWFLTGMEKHSDEYREDLYGNSEALYCSYEDAYALPSYVCTSCGDE